MTKKPFNKSKWTKFFIVLVVLGIVLGGCYFEAKRFWTPTILEKTTFSQEEQDTILDYLGIESNEAKVEKLLYTHARESVFTIFVTGLDDEALKPFHLSLSTENLWHERSEINGWEITSFFDEVEGRRMTLFKVNAFDEVLYDIVK